MLEKATGSKKGLSSSSLSEPKIRHAIKKETDKSLSFLDVTVTVTSDGPSTDNYLYTIA